MSEEATPQEKRTGLIDVIESQLTSLGEDFNVYPTPTAEQINLRSNLDNLDILRNVAGEIRMMNVFWVGTESAAGAPDGEARGLMVKGNRQIGAADRFRVTIHFGYAEGGSSYDPFATLLMGTEPDGLIRFLNRAPAIELDTGATALLSRVDTITIPPNTRPLTSDAMGSNNERAHYAQFTVTLTDTF